MATNAEIKALGRKMDAEALEDAARIMRKVQKPGGISAALFSRTMLIRADELRTEARELLALQDKESGSTDA